MASMAAIANVKNRNRKNRAKRITTKNHQEREFYCLGGRSGSTSPWSGCSRFHANDRAAPSSSVALAEPLRMLEYHQASQTVSVHHQDYQRSASSFVYRLSHFRRHPSFPFSAQRVGLKQTRSKVRFSCSTSRHAQARQRIHLNTLPCLCMT